jgi:RNA polymerase primary sigma factor
VIDNEEAASKVTVVKKKTRLSTATEAAQADVPVADASDVAEAPVKVVKVARKTLAAEGCAGRGGKAAPKSKLVKAKVTGAGECHLGCAIRQPGDRRRHAGLDRHLRLSAAGVKVPGRRGRKPSEFTPENDEIAALNAVERAELKAVSKARERKAKGG